MKECQKIRKDIVAFLCGELGPEGQVSVKAHLDDCVSCRNEFGELEFIHRESDSFISELAEAMSSVDWEALPEQIADKVFTRTRASKSSKLKESRPFSILPKWRPVFAGILVGIMIGSLATYVFFRMPRLQVAQAPELIFTSDFLEKAELEVARRETLEYLEKSQYLLLDFIQSPPQISAEKWKDEFALRQTQDLLSKKKFIDPQLDKFRMAKAKQICDQIEYLFYELTQISENLQPDDLKRIQDLIQERQVMLKIKLVTKELRNSEV